MRTLRSRQRGAATLLVSVMLLFAMTLMAAYANRNLVFEQRSAANLVRSTQAFEAAEAGAEWAVAMLNQRSRIDADCRPSTQPLDRSFRERRLRYNAADGMQQALAWDDAGKPSALLASCVHSAGGWACSCPMNGLPTLSTPAGADAHPAFTVQFAPATQPGMVRLSVTGCTSTGSTCTGNAAAHVQMLLGLVPGLSTLPAAPLTAKAGVAMTGSIGIHHADAAAGSLTVHSGADVLLPSARITTAPGSPAVLSIAERDGNLAALAGDAFFAAYFGLDPGAWRDQTVAARLSCATDCGAAVAAALADGTQLVWIDGDLAIDGPLTLGSRDHPVIVAASGTVRLRGGVVLHGVVYGGSRVRWDDTGADVALLRGAVVSQGSVEGNGAPDIVYDGAVLAALKNNSGSFARVPGSWRDF
ncbi:MAG TPA: PilX N-terminal domain-containing pilus assembly protein [Albitalea sp.]|nr:PilX N-terminal domain-containing pilus assembly protein [Albitalea sp.]